MGYIKKDFIDKLLDRAILQDVIGKFVKLDRAGANFKAKSPWSDDRTASLMVSPVKEIWKDFSTGKGGNMVNFVMEHESCSYPEAIEKIAGIYNESVEYEVGEFSEKKKEALERKEVLRKVLKAVHELYQKEYNALPAEHNAKKEVEIHRQYDADIILEWGIGFAPDNFLYNKFSSSGKVSIGEDLGLIVKQWDRYSNKVVYPIHDGNGLLIGFGGRDVSGKENQAKWINPPVNLENLLYNKSKVWYGLHKAKMAIRKRREAFVVEGYNDVIAWHLFGLENTVAPCGTAITEEQINILKKLCDKVVFCMDPDKAGKAAVLKQIPEFIQKGFRTDVILLELDPDDFVRQYHEAIVLSEGLDNMFKEPGVRIDGFKLLVNEFIKKDYYELEESLEQERLRLSKMLSDFELKKATLTADKVILEGDFLTADNLLKEIALISKKTDDYKEQHKTVTTVKGLLDKKKHELKNLTESVELKQQKNLVGILSKQYDQVFKASEISRASGAKHLCGLVICIEDEAILQTYINWIQIESKVSKSVINSWIKELKHENAEVEIEDEYDNYEYELPKDVKIPLQELEEDIKNHGLFMANNKIYFSIEKVDQGKIHFVALSNFEIEILQHMADEKHAALLVRLKNVMNHETIFDCPTESFNSLIRFKDVLSKHHNFMFKGKNNHLDKLYIFLCSKMGKGVKLDVPGYQLDGKFWVFNNLVITYEGELKTIDENGRYIQDNTHYYIPSANKIFKNNPYKYMQDKNFKFIENKVPFRDFISQAAKVHRHHYISPLLYGITSLFRDIVVKSTNSFPILFLYGQGGTGKDELGRMIMSLTGIPQMPISLEAEISTQKATMRMLAKFRNGIMMFSEYKRGNQKQDGALKGIYDNIGYSIGTIESKFSTDYIPVEAGLILTGNEFPDSEPLLQRVIWNQMDKNIFTQKEKEEMERHKEHLVNGMSQYAVEFLKHRKLVEQRFLDEYSKWSAILTPVFPDVKVRIVNNLSVIAAIYGIFSDIVDFPFTRFQMIDHFKIGVEQQMFRINSTSLLSKFWDCFISCFQGHPDNRIQANKTVSIVGSSIFLQWTNVYSKIQMQWFMIHKEAAPKKEVVMEELKKVPQLYVNYHSVFSFDEGRKAVRSSAVELNIKAIDSKIKNDILGAYMQQVYSETLFENEEFKDIINAYDVPKPNQHEAIPTENPEK